LGIVFRLLAEIDREPVGVLRTGPGNRPAARSIKTKVPLVKSEYRFMGRPQAGKGIMVPMEPAGSSAERMMQTVFAYSAR
jgi:hypothetical protein